MRIFLVFLSLAMGLVGCGNNQKELLPLEQGLFAVKPETISIRIKNYRPQMGNAFQHFFVSNFSVNSKAGALQLSTARDGMPDELKLQLAADYGFSVGNPESALAGFADLFFFKAGLKISQHSLLSCSGNQTQSSSHDVFTYQDNRYPGAPTRTIGYRDCVKNYMGLNPSEFDYDKDGIPDYLETRFGLNPLDKNDAYLSLAADGVMNIDKVKRNIPIDESAKSQPNQLFSYRYETIVNADASRDFVISNIPVLNSGSENFIAFYMVEVNVGNKAQALYTAYMIIRNGSPNLAIDIDYWATDPTQFYNVEIVGL